MSRKKLPEGQQAPSKGDSLNSLIKQLEDPRSLMSFLPIDVQTAFASIPEEYLALDEKSLLEKFEKELKWSPSAADETIRLNFWIEYDRVAFSKSESKMSMSNIYLGACSNAKFHRAIRTPHIAAFIAHRPLAYEVSYQALQELSNRKFHQILSLPIKEGGKVNIKLLELQMKTAAMVDLRNKGGYLNRSETKNLTMLSQKTEHTYTQVLTSKVGDKTAAQIEEEVKKQLEILEEEARMQLPPPAPRFEESEVVDAVYKDVEKNEQ